MDVGIPLVLAGRGRLRLDAGGAEVVVLQEAGLKPHVRHLDFLLVGARGFLAEVDLFQVGVDDEPDVGHPDRRAGGLHVADLDDVRRRDRVAKQVVERAIGAGHFAQGGALGVRILAIEQTGSGKLRSSGRLTPGPVRAPGCRPSSARGPARSEPGPPADPPARLCS